MGGDSPPSSAAGYVSYNVDKHYSGESGSPSTPRPKGNSLVDGGKLAFPYESHEQVEEYNSWQYFAKKFYYSTKKKQDERVASFTWLDWIGFFFPMFRWARKYNIKSYLIPDIVAGLCVGFMVVPQGMSYAVTAGVPSVYGLYGAFSPVLMYSAIGSSRQLAVGPVAVTSQLLHVQLVDIIEGSGAITNPNTLTVEQVQPLGSHGAILGVGMLLDCSKAVQEVPIQEAYNRATIQVAFLVAALYTAVGVLRLGFVTQFLSHSIIGGFISANALCIGLGQLKGVLLIPLPSPAPTTLHGLLHGYIHGAHDLIWQTTLFGGCLIIMLFTMRWIGGLRPWLVYVRAAAPLTACVVGLVAQYVGDVKEKGIPLIGVIPEGMPPCTIGWWVPVDKIDQLFPVAVIIMFVDLLESTSIARALARKNGYLLAPNQEIVGLGLANFVGAAFNAYTTTGSFSRSAVNNASGARTPLAACVSALVVGAVLLWLTPVFEHLPNCVLGAIIVAAMPSLFEYEQLIYLWKVDKLDCACWLASFLGVCFISVEIGLAIAIGLAVVLVIFHSAFPSVVVLGRVPSTATFRDIAQYNDALLTPGVLALRIDSSIYFANQQFIKDKAERSREKFSVWSTDQGVSLAYAILDMSMVLHVDSAGCHALEDILLDFRIHNTQVLLANPSVKVMRALELAGLPELIGREWIFVSTHDAQVFCQARLQEQGISVPAGGVSYHNGGL